MTNRKKMFSTDERKSGFIKVSRSQLAAMLGNDQEQAMLAKLLLCVQYHVYFTQGRVCLGKNVYDCFPGQWVTSCVHIAEIMQVSRKVIRGLLETMQSEGWLKVDKLQFGCRIELNGTIASSAYRVDHCSASFQGATVSDADSFYSKGYY